MDIVIAWDFHILEPLEKGAGSEMLPMQETLPQLCVSKGVRGNLYSQQPGDLGAVPVM